MPEMTYEQCIELARKSSKKLDELIEKLKAEYNIEYSLANIKAFVRECAYKVKEGDYSAIDDETVKNLILAYRPELKPKKAVQAVSSENKKSVEEIKQEAIAEANKRAEEMQKKAIEGAKKRQEEKKRDWEQTSLGFWNV